MKQLLISLVRDDQGQDLIEYGLLVGVITVGAIAAITAIGPKVLRATSRTWTATAAAGARARIAPSRSATAISSMRTGGTGQRVAVRSSGPTGRL